MKIQNKSRYPSCFINDLLDICSKITETDNSNIQIVARNSNDFGCNGHAKDGNLVGLKLPRLSFKYALGISQTIFRVMVHEWRHIKQHQDKLFSFARAEYSKTHNERDFERDANEFADNIMNNLPHEAQDKILELAIWIEGQNDN